MRSSGNTIAILVAHYDDYVKAVVDAVAAVAEDAGYGTVCVCGGSLESASNSNSRQAVRNGIYRLFEQVDVAGILCESGTLGHQAGPHVIAPFISRFNVPCVSIGVDVPDVPSVIVDDRPGMRRLMTHLLEDPSRRRFAFVRGLAQDMYSMEREGIFRDMLMRHGRDVDESLFVTGNYDAFDAYNAVEALLLEHPDVDTIVAANDTMALSAARAVRALKLSIPYPIAVSGFDDVPDATRLVPALTTVRQPLSKLAGLSIRKLLLMIDGRHTETDRLADERARLSSVSSELVVRGSTRSLAKITNTPEHIDSDELEGLLSSGMTGLGNEQGPDLQSIAVAMAHTLTHGSSRLAEQLQRELDAADDVDGHLWSNLCHLIEELGARYAGAGVQEEHPVLIIAALVRVKERIWATAMEREFEARRVERTRAVMQLQVGSCTDVAEIADAMEHWARANSPKRLFLVRYDNHDACPQASGQLLFAFRNGVREDVPDAMMKTAGLLPARFAEELCRGMMLLIPVYAGDQHYGYLMIDPEDIELSDIDHIGQSIGNAMRSSYLIDTLEAQTKRLKDSNANLSEQANHDALTGLPNRLCLERRLRDLCEMATSETRFALCFMDLDGFKLVNDTFGHEMGDLLLQAVAQRLCGSIETIVKAGSFIARLGGDEFVALIRTPTLDEDLGDVFHALLTSMAAPFTLSGETLTISTSIGAALYPDHADEATSLLKRADIAMYEAKARGKNGVALYRRDRMAKQESRSHLVHAMRKSLDDGSFHMHFQPRVELAHGTVCAVESLMRWTKTGANGELADVGPSIFIPLAEECGLINRIDEIALENSCRQARSWERAGTPIRVAVNVSAMQLQQDGFVSLVKDTLARHELAPSLLELEITESAVMRDIHASVRHLKQLRDLGVHLSIDDFGTGHSSLSYLQQLPVHTLKIDRSFVSELDANPDEGRGTGVILRAIVALGQSLGFTLVAEGIETEAQWRIIESLGCEEGQGYLFGRPQAAEHLDIVPPNSMVLRAVGS